MELGSAFRHLPLKQNREEHTHLVKTTKLENHIPVGTLLKQNCDEHTRLKRIAKVHNVVFPPALLKQNYEEHTRLMRITKVQKVGSRWNAPETNLGSLLERS